MLGYNLFHYGYFNDTYGVVPGWMQSPGWPFVVGIFSYLLPLHQLAPIVTLILSIIIGFIFYFFIKKYFSLTVALLGTCILVINPQFLIISGSGLSEPLYLLVHMSLFFLLYVYWFQPKKASLAVSLLLSFLSVILMLIRSEGVLYTPLIVFILVKTQLKTKNVPNKCFNEQPRNKQIGKLRYLQLNNYAFYSFVLYFIILSLLLVPYGNWVKEKTGYFSIIPKIIFNARVGKIADLLSLDKNMNLLSQELKAELAWYGLDENTNELYSANILDNHYYQKITYKIKNGSKWRPNFFTLILKNLKETVLVVLRSNPFPIIFILIVLIGLYYLFKLDKCILAFIVVWLIPSFYFLVSHVQERFFYIMLPYFSFIAAYGIYELGQKLKKKNLLYAITLALLILNATYYYSQYYYKLQEKEVYYQVAQNLRKSIPSDVAICAKEFQATFYSGNNFVKMPYCSIEALYKYLKKNNAQYLLLGEEVNGLRKVFKPIFIKQRTEQFQLINTYSTSFQTFKLFKIL